LDNSIVRIDLDNENILHRSLKFEQEFELALSDLLEKNRFELQGNDTISGPYIMKIALKSDRLVFSIFKEDGQLIKDIFLALKPFRSLIKDYYLICESYFNAIEEMTSSQIEAIDIGRRGLHNEAAQLLTERLEKHVEMDKQTARRFFTLLCALQVRG